MIKNLKRLILFFFLPILTGSCSYFQTSSLKLSPSNTNALNIITLARDTANQFIVHYIDNRSYKLYIKAWNYPSRTIQGDLIPITTIDKEVSDSRKNAKAQKRKNKISTYSEVHFYIENTSPNYLKDVTVHFENIFKIYSHDKNEIIFQSTNPSPHTLSILQDTSKYVIVHFENTVAHLSNINIDYNLKAINGVFNPLEEDHLSYLSEPSGYGNRYNPKKSNPTNEVHLYVNDKYSKSIFHDGIGFGLISKIDVYNEDLKKRRDVILAITIPIAVVVGLGIAIYAALSTMSFTFSGN